MSTIDAPAATPSKFPINRVVAFAGPYVAILSGAVADWLLVHVHLLDLFHTTSTQVAGAITQLVVFALTSLLVWLGQHKWLDGWQKWEGVIETAIAGEHVNGPDDNGSFFDEPEDYDPVAAGDGFDPADEPEAEPEVIEEPEVDPPPPPPAARKPRASRPPQA